MSSKPADEKVSSPISGCASWVMGHRLFVMSYESWVISHEEKFSLSEYNNSYCPCWLGGVFVTYETHYQT